MQVRKGFPLAVAWGDSFEWTEFQSLLFPEGPKSLPRHLCCYIYLKAFFNAPKLHLHFKGDGGKK